MFSRETSLFYNILICSLLLKHMEYFSLFLLNYITCYCFVCRFKVILIYWFTFKNKLKEKISNYSTWLKSATNYFQTRFEYTGVPLRRVEKLHFYTFRIPVLFHLAGGLETAPRRTVKHYSGSLRICI